MQRKYSAEHSLTNPQQLYLQHWYLSGGRAEPGDQDGKIQCEEENNVGSTSTGIIYSGQAAMPTLTATFCPSWVRAAWTCAREALASGTGSNSAKTYAPQNREKKN